MRGYRRTGAAPRGGRRFALPALQATLARSSTRLRSIHRRTAVGWLAVALSSSIASLWGFWGAIENFHEGWYLPTLGENLAMMLAQYVGSSLLFSALAAASLRWPRAGGSLHAAIAVALISLLFGWQRLLSPGVTLIGGPLVLIGVLYWYGRARPLKWAYLVAVGLPLAVIVISGAEPAYRVAGRVDDGYRGARIVQGNGVRLTWAPAGPGWPADGVTWEEAGRICRYLNADGTGLADTPQDIWRLPTVEEAVHSMVRHGENAGGVWDATSGRASYRTLPDKESPLWDTRSKVIYWWTSTEVDERQALIVVYNGGVWPRAKAIRPGYLGFRAVKDTSAMDP
jgi:hypothetical protein